MVLLMVKDFLAGTRGWLNGYECFTVPPNVRLYRGGVVEEQADEHLWLTELKYALPYIAAAKSTGYNGQHSFQVLKPLHLFVISPANVSALATQTPDILLQRALSRVYSFKGSGRVVDTAGYLTAENAYARIPAVWRLAIQMQLELANKGFDGWIVPQPIFTRPNGFIFHPEVMIWKALSERKVMELPKDPEELRHALDSRAAIAAIAVTLAAVTGGAYYYSSRRRRRKKSTRKV